MGKDEKPEDNEKRIKESEMKILPLKPDSADENRNRFLVLIKPWLFGPLFRSFARKFFSHAVQMAALKLKMKTVNQTTRQDNESRGVARSSEREGLLIILQFSLVDDIS